MEGVCEAIHDDNAARVTLAHGETLEEAWIRLYNLAPGVGGIIQVPWDVDTVQCDSLRLNQKKTQNTPKITIRGIVGPNGEQPRFYCRSDSFPSGTVPDKEVAGAFLSIGSDYDTMGTLLVENIHKDGYKTGIQSGNNGKVIIRNSYFHHGRQDGVKSGNSIGDADYNRNNLDANALYTEPSRYELEICGTEIAFHGQGNTIHGFYMHRALGGGGDRSDLAALNAGPGWHKNTVVDSVCHTSNHSSCFKSIANEVILKNNKFYQYLATDPSYLVDAGPDAGWGPVGEMLVDISACSISTIVGNSLYGFRPTAQAGSGTLVAYRLRKRAVRGCDIPVAWTPYGDGIDNGDGIGASKSGPEPSKIDGLVHTEEFWRGLNNKIFFPHIVEDNFFEVTGDFAGRQDAVSFYSTYPVYETRLGSPNCFLPTPDAWYERAHVFSARNHFVNFPADRRYVQIQIGQDGKDVCPYPENDPDYPPGPGPDTTDNFTVGPGDTYQESTPSS
jgi:hypothetical protein